MNRLTLFFKLQLALILYGLLRVTNAPVKDQIKIENFVSDSSSVVKEVLYLVHIVSPTFDRFNPILFFNLLNKRFVTWAYEEAVNDYSIGEVSSIKNNSPNGIHHSSDAIILIKNWSKKHQLNVGN